jgi:hypothetical protein
MHAFAEWLASTPISIRVQEILWIIPLLQTVHILAIAMVLSATLMVDLRILGFPRTTTVAETVQRFMPWLWTGLALLLGSGLVLIIGEPRRTLDHNPVFMAKMILLALAVALALALQGPLRRNIRPSNNSTQHGKLMSMLAVLSLVLWCSIAVAGRWIAYARAS